MPHYYEFLWVLLPLRGNPIRFYRGKGYLVDNLNMSPKYWGFFQLTDEQFDAILKKGEVDEGVIID